MIIEYLTTIQNFWFGCRYYGPMAFDTCASLTLQVFREFWLGLIISVGVFAIVLTVLYLRRKKSE